MARQHYELGLGLSEEHRSLAEAIAGLAERVITPEVVRKDVDASATDRLPPFWDALVDHEVPGLHLPEELGGSGGGLLTLAVALEAIGRHAAPGPLVPTVLASALLAADGGKPAIELAPRLADGSTLAAVALETSGVGRLTDGVVTGTWDGVLGADHADLLLLPVDQDGSTTWVALDASDLTVSAQDGIDVVRRSARVEAAGISVAEERVLASLDARRARSVAAVVLGAEALGVQAWCVATAAEYAKIRVQFGRPIGQFQGVKHTCARMGIALEQARAALWDAAVALDRADDTADFAAEVAAVVVPDAAVATAQDCIQVHGGIGFTWEHDAHLYYRRALTLRALLGSREERSLRVADRAQA